MEIIVASSNLFRRELSSFLLCEAGYIVHEVSDSASLFRSLEHIRPAMVLLDERLRGRTCTDITYKIQQHNPAIRIILLKNSSSLLGGIPSASAYSDDSLDWPYQAEDLLSHVSSVLHRTPNMPCFTSPSPA